MNLLYLFMITLLFPIVGSANPHTIVQRRVIPNKIQTRYLRRPASAAPLVVLKPLAPASSLVIAPKLSLIIPSKPKGPTFFKLSKVPSKQEIAISFESYDRHLQLDRKFPLVIQLFPEYPLRLNRSLIVGSVWPKNNTSLAISFSDATPKVQNKITGKASYTYCHDKTHLCKTVLDSIIFYFIP
jgi:hypothetical protein